MLALMHNRSSCNSEDASRACRRTKLRCSDKHDAQGGWITATLVKLQPILKQVDNQLCSQASTPYQPAYLVLYQAQLRLKARGAVLPFSCSQASRAAAPPTSCRLQRLCKRCSITPGSALGCCLLIQ